jgi:hypothetical protein
VTTADIYPSGDISGMHLLGSGFDALAMPINHA